MDPRDLLSPAAIIVLIAVMFCITTLKKVLYCWRTAYGLTDRRVIIVAGDRGATRSYEASAFNRIERSGDHTYGTIRFDLGRSWGGRMDDFAALWRGGHWRAGLYGIKNPAYVEAEINKTLLLHREKGSVNRVFSANKRT
jgi:hypothetical protein